VVNNIDQDKPEGAKSKLITIYLLLAFGLYFLTVMLTRLARIRDLLGL
jgi:hypothetical protein